MELFKNTSGQYIYASLGITTGTVTFYYEGDGGSQTQGGVSSGAGTHTGNGVWRYAPSQAETNYNQILFTAVHSSGVVQSIIVDTRVLTDIATADTVVDAIKAKTDNLAFNSGAVDANMLQVNDVPLTGAGVDGDRFRPA